MQLPAGSRDPHRPSRTVSGRASRVRRKQQTSPRKFWIAGAVYLTFAVCLALVTATVLHAQARPDSAGRASQLSFNQTSPKYLVLMVLDGARPDYFTTTSLPHLNALQASGTEYTQAISGILEAETPSGHATIATGSRPDRSGILGFDWVADDSRYSLFDPAKMSALEQILQDAHASTIGSLYKQKFPTAKVVALSGHKYYAAAPLGGPAADAIMYYEGDPKGRYVPVAVPGHVPPAGILNDPSLTLPTVHLPDAAEDHLATKLALATVSRMHPRILLMNYPEFDWPLGHVDGGMLNKAKVITDMQGFDQDLGSIEDAYRKAGILNQTVFVITADHGMMPISRFVPASIVTDAITKAGTTAPDIASSTGDFVWLADSTKGQAVADNIVNVHDPGIQSAYYLSVAGGPHYVAADGLNLSAATETTNQYLLQSFLNGHEPTVVVFGNEGATFSDPKTGWKADHGGNSWQSQHLPLLLAGAGIKAGQTLNSPAQLEDIAPTVLTDMGVQPTGMEGHVLTEALAQPPSAAKQARSAEVAQLSPVFKGMLLPEPTATATGGQ